MKHSFFAVGILVSCSACVGDSTATNDGGIDASNNDASTNDAIADVVSDVAPDAADAAPVSCSPTKPFGAPQPISGFATAAWEAAPRLSPDELTMWFEGGGGTYTNTINLEQLFVATRTSRTVAFGAATPLAIDTSATYSQMNPTVTSNGLTLFYTFWGSPANEARIWVATRANELTDFTGPAALAGIATNQNTSWDSQPFITADGKELWFNSTRTGGGALGGQDIYVAPQTGQTYSNPTLQSALSSSSDDWFPILSDDRLTIYIATNRVGGNGNNDIWRSTRASTQDAFPAPTVVTELNSGNDDLPAWLSPDNCRLYISTTRINGDSWDLFMAERAP